MLIRAEAAQPAWDALGGSARAELLIKASDLFEAHSAEIVSLCQREAGKTLTDSVLELREAVDFLRYYACEARMLFSAPLFIGMAWWAGARRYRVRRAGTTGRPVGRTTPRMSSRTSGAVSTSGTRARTPGSSSSPRPPRPSASCPTAGAHRTRPRSQRPSSATSCGSSHRRLYLC